MKSTINHSNTIKSLRRIVFICSLAFFPFFLKAQLTDTVSGKKYYDEAIELQKQNNTTNNNKILRLLNKSSDAGYIEAYKMLSGLHYNNPKLVFKYTKKAAEAGDFEYMHLLTSYYVRGYGTTKNLDVALEWIEKGIAMGDVLAKMFYCEFYFNKEEGNDPDKGYVYEQEKDSLFNVAFSYEDAPYNSPEKIKSQTYYTILSQAGYGKASYRIAKTNNGYEFRLSYLYMAREQGFPVPQEDIDFNENWLKTTKTNATANPRYYSHIKTTTTNKNQKVCPFCHGAGSSVTQASKSIEQQKDGKWYNTYTPSKLSTCAYCKGTGYF